MRHYFKHYNTSFLISVDQILNADIRDKTEKALMTFFHGFLKSDKDNVDLAFIFTDNIYSFLNDVDFVSINGIKSGSNQIHYKDDELEFVINRDEPYRFIININELVLSSIPCYNRFYIFYFNHLNLEHQDSVP